MQKHTRQNQNGKIERSFRTVKDNFINCNDWNTFTSLGDLNERYYNYVNSEYNNNFHSSIEDTPRNRFMKDYSKLKFVKSEEILEEYFLHTFERRVSTDSTIQLFCKCYEVPSKYIKQSITVKVNPHDLDNVYIHLTNYSINKNNLKYKSNNNIKKQQCEFFPREETEGTEAEGGLEGELFNIEEGEENEDDNKKNETFA